MTGGRDHPGDMARFPLDDATADRLLSGRVAPGDAPPGYGHLASLIASATGPASPGEVAQETVVARAAAAVTGRSALSPATRGRTMLSKLLTAKFVGLTAAATLGVGTAAAAVSGVLPGQNPSPTQNLGVAAPNPSTTAASSTTSASTGLVFKLPTTGSKQEPTESAGPLTSTHTDVTTGTDTSTGSVPATGMDNSESQFGLCTAFLAHQPPATSTAPAPGNSGEAPPFQALMSQHGGAAGTVTYCQGVVAAHSSSTTTEPRSTDRPETPPVSTAKQSDTPKPSDTNRSSDGTNPSGTAKPSDAGSPSSSHSDSTDHSGPGTAGSGSTGSGTAGSGTAGSGTAGSGTAGSGTAGSGTAATTQGH